MKSLLTSWIAAQSPLTALWSTKPKWLLPLTAVLLLALYVWMFLPACMLVQQMCVWYLWKQEESVGSPKPGVVHSCELLCMLWETNLDYQNVNKCSSPRTT